MEPGVASCGSADAVEHVGNNAGDVHPGASVCVEGRVVTAHIHADDPVQPGEVIEKLANLVEMEPAGFGINDRNQGRIEDVDIEMYPNPVTTREAHRCVLGDALCTQSAKGGGIPNWDLCRVDLFA